jgi:hypothetical protein
METKMTWEVYWVGNLMHDRQKVAGPKGKEKPTEEAKTAGQVADEKWREYKEGKILLAQRRVGEGVCEYLFKVKEKRGG